jgi:hypothetical protein
MRAFRIAVVALFATRGCDARMLAPMRRSTAIKILQRLTEGSLDLISIDIGGTLAKVMVYQPVESPPAEDGGPPELDLGEALVHDAAFKDPEQLALSLYAPELGGNLVRESHTSPREPH